MSHFLNDPTYLTLQEANRVWKLAMIASFKERIGLATELHKWEAFSLNQLSKICRLNKSVLTRRLDANSGGGKFEPEALTYLMQIRRAVLAGRDIPLNLLTETMQAGVSVNAIATLTGASASVLYKQLGTANILLPKAS